MYCVAENRYQHSDEYDKHLFYVSYFYNFSSPSGTASGSSTGNSEYC